MSGKRKTFAGRLTRSVLIWLFVIVLGLSFFVFYIGEWVTREFYAESYHNKTLITNEYTRRVISDVYVAVTNNIYYLEQHLDDPDYHKSVMERIVKSGTRVRSCGISFIDSYYPQKGRRFCPFAWRNVANPDVVYSENMGDTDLDYLDAGWFLEIIEGDTAKWTDPFYDGYDNTTPLTAYMAPIHDKQGRTVAALGADVSLGWLTEKLNETDSTINQKISFAANILQLSSNSFIINHKGVFITHPDGEHILKENFFTHIESCDGSDVERLSRRMKNGEMSSEESDETFLFDGQKSYVFFTPVKYTDWVIITIVPTQHIEMLGYFVGLALLAIIALAMLIIVMVGYYYVKNGIEPLKGLAMMADGIAKGRFDAPMPDIKHDDELAYLRDSLEKMQYTLSNRQEK